MWGCLEKVQVPKPKQVKIGLQTIDCIFIGYANNSKAYHFLVCKSEIPDIHSNTIIESDNAELFEDIFPYKRMKAKHLVKVPSDHGKLLRKMCLILRNHDVVNVKGYLNLLVQIF